MKNWVTCTVAMLSAISFDDLTFCCAYSAQSYEIASGDGSTRADPDVTVDLDQLLTLFRERNETGTLFATRDQWPRDVPVRVMVKVPQDIGDVNRKGHVIQLADCDDEAFASMTVLSHGIVGPGPDRSMVWHDGTQGIPATCIDENGNVEFNVIVRSRSTINVRSTLTETMTFNIELVESVNDIIQPVANDDLTGHLAENVSIFLRSRRTARDEVAGLRVHLPLGLPTDLTIAFKIELLAGEDEHLLGVAWFTTNRWYRLTEAMWDAEGWRAVVLHIESDLSGARLMEEAGRHPVRARITSDPEYALRDFENTRYWHGSFTTDVEVVAWDD